MISRDLLNISDWNKGILVTRLRAFHTHPDIPLLFSQERVEESVVAADGLWGVDIMIPECAGGVGGIELRVRNWDRCKIVSLIGKSRIC